MASCSPSVGWVVWRDSAALPSEPVFDVDYLGGSMPTFALDFSRPGAQIAAQCSMAGLFLADLGKVTRRLAHGGVAAADDERGTSFHH